MIQPQELRLGNYVYDRGEKVIRIDFFEHLENGYDCKFGQNGIVDPEWGHTHPLTEYTEYAKPIPLTEEWLLKFGFENDTYGNFTLSLGDILDVQWVMVSFKYYDLKEWDSTQFSDNNLMYDCKYVHQLQNLYFSLTGKELEVKP